MIVELKKSEKVYGIKSNKRYAVISMEFLATKNVNDFFKLRIVNENGIPGLYDKKLFKIVDNMIDVDYVIKEHNDESFELVPEKMSYKNFWIDFFNLESSAIDVFKKRFPEYKDILFY